MRQKHLLILFIIILGISVAFGSLRASGFTQGIQDTAGQVNAYQGGYVSPENIAAGIIKTLLTLVGIIFLLLMIYGGYLWMTARGNPENIKKAKTTLTSSIIGLGIIILSYSITYFITSQIESPGGGTPAFKQTCEDSTELNYYSLNCCEYRFQVYNNVTVDCCQQSLFCNNHPAECATQGGFDPCP